LIFFVKFAKLCHMAARLSTLIHHITTLCEPESLGRTRLAKILWLSDVEHYRLTGKTISGVDDYRKDEYGPRHRNLYDAIEELKKSGRVVSRQSLTPVGPRQELIPVSKPDLSGFSAEEIAVIDRITAAVIKLSAKQASDLTHDELWETTLYNQQIPVAAAAPISGEATAEFEQWADEIVDANSAAG
jgi:hypothetical protein